MARATDKSPSGKKNLLGGALDDLKVRSDAAIAENRAATGADSEGPGGLELQSPLTGPNLEVASPELTSDTPIRVDKALRPALDIPVTQSAGIDKSFLDSLAYEEGGDRVSDGKGNFVSNVTPDGKWKPYQDAAGLWTVGVGHLIGDGKSGPGKFAGGIPKAEVDKMFAQDVEKAVTRARKAFGAEEFDTLPTKAKQILTDFTFNMGTRWVKGFPRMVEALRKHDIPGALKESGRGYTAKSGEFRLLTYRNLRFLQRYAE